MSVQPAVQFTVGGLARFRDGQEHVVLGVGDRYDGGPVADASGPAGDLLDVQHRVAALDDVGVCHLAHTAIGAQDQVGYADVEAAVQFGVSAPDRVDPAERDGKSADRLPTEVIVEFARIVAVQRRTVAALGDRWAHHGHLAHPRQRRDRRAGRGGTQERRTLQVQPGTVEYQAADSFALRQAATAQSVQEQGHDEPAGGVPVHEHVGRRFGIDDVQRADQLTVVAVQVGGEMRSLALPPRPSAFV